MLNLFKKYNIDKRIIDKLEVNRITVPTKIQEDVIPAILNGKDAIAQSRTGSGKTLAYLIPLFDNVYKKKEKIIIIAPTNELVKQIHQEALRISDETITIISASGGENISTQISSIKKGFDVLIGVTGRIIKLIESGALKAGIFKKMVLDEVDFMIDLGFYPDLQKIFGYAPNINQFMVFSATMSQKTKGILDLMHNQKYAYRPDAKNLIPENISNFFIPIKEKEERLSVLIELTKIANPYLAIIFARTRDEVDWLYNKLKDNSIDVVKLSGALTPQQRKKALVQFKDAKTQYLLSTDLASRGLDVESVTHIINYNLPYNSIDFVHRAGRTGRMENKGIVISICNPLDEGYLKKYAFELGFNPIPVKIENSRLVEDSNHKGVKPRFSLTEIQKNKRVNEAKQKPEKKSMEKKYAGKIRNKRKR